MRRRRLVKVALGGAAALVAIFLVLRAGPGAPAPSAGRAWAGPPVLPADEAAEPDAVAAAEEEEEAEGEGAPAAAPAKEEAKERSPRAEVPLDQWADPEALTDEERETRRRYRLVHARLARDAYEQHPFFSRPIRENEDQVVPELVAATVRPLAPPPPDGRPTAVFVRQTQDRIFLRPGSVAHVGLQAATAEGNPVPASVVSAALVRWAGSPPASAEPLVRVGFAPAGAMLAATFTAPAEALGSYTGDLLLRADVQAGGERGTLVWAFVYTGAPPAVFTGRTRDRLDQGSVVFEAGVDVRRAGRYRITGRVDDAAGKPLALARFDGELAAGAFVVPLVLHGKIARDEGGVSPFVLRDLEGFRLLEGVYPDRETLEPWAGPYRSREYRPEELSDAPWPAP